jgi:hypothetical protein
MIEAANVPSARNRSIAQIEGYGARDRSLLDADPVEARLREGTGQVTGK